MHSSFHELAVSAANCNNAHHLSTTAVTDILEAYGAAISDMCGLESLQAKEFALMADGSTKCNGQQMTRIRERMFQNKNIN